MYTKFTTPPDTELSIERLQQILETFQTADLPKMQRLQNYYIGKHDIIYKEVTDAGRKMSHIVINYCKQCVNTFQGYLLGKPIALVGNDTDELNKILDYNDSNALFSEYLRNALIFGRSFLLAYIDEESKQRLQIFPTMECIPVYSNTIEGELLYTIRFWVDNSKGNLDTQAIYRVEVWGPDSVKHYTSGMGFNSLEPEGEDEPNFYRQCQVTCFSLNPDEEGIFQQIIPINDAINELYSDSVVNASEFADAYLVLQGLTATKEDLSDMKKSRCILLDGDEHCNASFLTKNIADTQVVDLLDNLTTAIFSIGCFPDWTSPQLFGNASSGVSLEFKIQNFEQASSNIEVEMRKAIQRIIELLATIISYTDESMWRDVRILFTRNLPVNLSEITQMVTALRGIVSNETLLSLLPFVDDPKEEVEKLEKENETANSLYEPQIKEEYIINE